VYLHWLYLQILYAIFYYCTLSFYYLFIPEHNLTNDILQNISEPSIIMHTYNSRTWEGEKEGFQVQTKSSTHRWTLVESPISKKK
jgi:hypothetical protein